MTTQALASFGVYGSAGEDELAVLELANEFREAYCLLQWEWHRTECNLRDVLIPTLFPAMVEASHVAALIWQCEREIKAYHSHVRDRDAVTQEQDQRLRDLRDQQQQAAAILRPLRSQWIARLKAWRDWRKAAADWKNVKSLVRRREAYAALVWPNEHAQIGTAWCEWDLRCRELSESFQNRGLHSSIRAEIIAASKPKLGKDGPGMSYEFHRSPKPKPWQKITLQIAGGLSIAGAESGIGSLSLTPRYENHKARGAERIYRVRQQIGTISHPRWVEYSVKFHRPLPENLRIQRWTLVVKGSRRTCVPVFAGVELRKPRGEGTVTCTIDVQRVAGGVRVATFAGCNINETLIVPQWIVEEAMAVSAAQIIADTQANSLLAERGEPTPHARFQGTTALLAYCKRNPDDTAAAEELRGHERCLAVALKESQRARRCITSIYETVTYRVAARHSTLVLISPNLAKQKRKKTRDLLQPDPLSDNVRLLRQTVAPGRLKELLLRSGMEDGEGAASDEAQREHPVVARGTDVFTTYIAELGLATGTKPQENCRRSQLASSTDAV